MYNGLYKFIVSNLKEDSISIQRVTAYDAIRTKLLKWLNYLVRTYIEGGCHYILKLAFEWG